MYYRHYNKERHRDTIMVTKVEIDRAVVCVRDYSNLTMEMGQDMEKKLQESLHSEPDEDTREWWDDIMVYLKTLNDDSKLLGTDVGMRDEMKVVNRMKVDVASVLDSIVDELDMMQMGYLCSDVIRDDIFKTIVGLQRGLVKLGEVMVESILQGDEA